LKNFYINLGGRTGFPFVVVSFRLCFSKQTGGLPLVSLLLLKKTSSQFQQATISILAAHHQYKNKYYVYLRNKIIKLKRRINTINLNLNTQPQHSTSTLNLNT
jgi:hypothetical protein